MALNPIANHKQMTDGAAIRYLQRKQAQKQMRQEIIIVCAWPVISFVFIGLFLHII
tara:strand:+ start:644 stop:811 length:168 start_codon:yes stop_codon:yes gene_type:complete